MRTGGSSWFSDWLNMKGGQILHCTVGIGKDLDVQATFRKDDF